MTIERGVLTTVPQEDESPGTVWQHLPKENEARKLGFRASLQSAHSRTRTWDPLINSQVL
jgi:hypothetical protein